jgi:hypothetical protein
VTSVPTRHAGFLHMAWARSAPASVFADQASEVWAPESAHQRLPVAKILGPAAPALWVLTIHPCWSELWTRSSSRALFTCWLNYLNAFISSDGSSMRCWRNPSSQR